MTPVTCAHNVHTHYIQCIKIKKIIYIRIKTSKEKFNNNNILLNIRNIKVYSAIKFNVCINIKLILRLYLCSTSLSKLYFQVEVKLIVEVFVYRSLFQSQSFSFHLSFIKKMFYACILYNISNMQEPVTMSLILVATYRPEPNRTIKYVNWTMQAVLKTFKIQPHNSLI